MISTKDQQKILDAVQQKIVNLFFETHAEIVKNAPIDTGKLRRSIVIEQEGKDAWYIGSNLDYAEYVEVGVSPHVIKPINKKALKFQIGGETIFAKKVNHPGFEGFAMFTKGVSFFEREVKRLAKR